ncbi:uncharacterized protein [Hyperolius riggenbachi]|uniref:uncharacterized protein n=1 Tax=Hyperolius riggenbachi TaxID=752182 RepID=UPI0035A3367E
MSQMDGTDHTQPAATTHLTDKNNKAKSRKPLLLFDFIKDPDRTDPLIGLQYVTEMRVPVSNKGSIIKCNVCRVKGPSKTMIEHLSGIYHIERYMEMYYFTELQSIRRSKNKTKVSTLVKDFAREIERAEGTHDLQIEYVSLAELNKEKDSWIHEADKNSKYPNMPPECSVLDKRLLALKYSETFKISSRAEASIVLKLTEQLSDNLEKYFLTCKGLEQVLEKADLRPEALKITPDIHPPAIYGNIDAGRNVGLEITAVNPVLNIEAPSTSTSSMCSMTDAHAFERLNVKVEADCGEKATSEGIPSWLDAFPESSSASDSPGGKRRKLEDPDEMPYMFSSSSAVHRYDKTPTLTSVNVTLTQPSSTSSASSSYSTKYTDHRAPEPKASDPHYAVFQDDQNTAHSSNVAQVGRITNTDVDDESEIRSATLPRSPEVKTQPGLDVDDEDDDLYATSPPNGSEEAQSSSQSQGKTSKALSPDILQLLKGKDATTVTNILKTISPFYPALQDVNLEILAQVLVNTGALD